MEQSKPRIEDALALSRRYGSIALIPEVELTQIGYQRLEDGRLVPLGFVPKSLDPLMPGLEKKNESAPFGKIDLTVKCSEVRRSGVVFTYEEIQARAERADWDLGRWSNGQVALNQFESDFADWAASKDDSLSSLDQAARLHVATRISTDMREIEPENYFTEQLYKHENSGFFRGIFFNTNISPDQEFLSTEGMLALWTELEKVRAKLDDPGLQDKIYTSSYELDGDIKSPLDENMDPDTLTFEASNYFGVLIDHLEGVCESKAEMQQALRELAARYHTQFEISLDKITEYLRFKGLPIAAQNLALATTDAQARDIMLQEFASSGDLAAKNDEINVLKKKIREASHVERQSLSEGLSNLKKEFKDIKKIIKGVADYFDIPRLAGAALKKEIKDLQKELIIVRDGDTSLELVLDGKLDVKKDADPGAMAGDCTEGRPLPFDVPSVPVYNIKVYEKEGDNHIGNIYLLATTADESQKIWHLEAIQIPNRRIDWANFPASLVSALVQQAEQQDVKAITINTTKPTISNFDYIADAFLDYVNAHGSAYPSSPIVDYPSNPDRDIYSSFQGSGLTYSLWQKSS